MPETTFQKSSRNYSRPHTKEERKKQKREREKKRKRERRLKNREEHKTLKKIKLDGATELEAMDRSLSTSCQEKSTSIPTLSINVRHSPASNEHKFDMPEASAEATTGSNKQTNKDGKETEIKRSRTESNFQDHSRGKQMVILAKKIGGRSTLECAAFQKPSSSSYLARQYCASYNRAKRPRNAVTIPVREVDYQLISKSSDIPVGNGSFGTCYLAHYRNIKVAVKEMRKRNNSLTEKERCRLEVLHEAKVLYALGDHPSSPLLLGICSVKEPYCLVLQFHGTEKENLTLEKAVNRKLLKKSQVIQVFRDICSVLQYVHGKGYLHNDIKSNNVLLQPFGESEYQPVLIDFGKSKLIEQGERRSRSKVSASYLAPEVVKGNRETIASDVYSFGKMLQLAVSRRSFRKSFENLVARITSISPNERPSTEEIIVSLGSLDET